MKPKFNSGILFILVLIGVLMLLSIFYDVNIPETPTGKLTASTGKLIGDDCTVWYDENYNTQDDCDTSGIWCNIKYGGETQNHVCCEYGKNCCKYQSDCVTGETCIQNVCYGPSEGTLSAGDYCLDSSGWAKYEACGPGLVCNANYCCDAYHAMLSNSGCCKYHGSCLSGYECGLNYYCVQCSDTSNCRGDVGEYCYYANDCRTGLSCQNNVCVGEGGSALKSDGETCSSSSQCESGNCRNGVCCDSGQICCKYDSDCPDDYYCGNTVWYCFEEIRNAQPGEYCPSDENCVSGHCVHNTCCESGECCMYDSDCGSNSYECDKSVYQCVLKSPSGGTKMNGEMCTSSSECISGNCKNYVCCQSGKTCCNYDADCHTTASDIRSCDKSKHYCVEEEEEIVTLKSDGETCYSSSECESGWCTWYGDEDLCRSGDCGNNDAQGYVGYCCDYGKDCCDIDYDGACLQYVGENYECGLNHYCIEKTIQTTTIVKKGICEKCTDDSECETGRCGGYDPRCYPKEGGSCCPDKTYVKEGFNRVEGSGCCSNDNCGEGLKCVDNLCVKTEVEPLTGIVVSVEPRGDDEALEIKKLIEEEIYPAIVTIFDENSNQVFTGPRDNDKEINLKMSEKESVASWDEESNIMVVPYARLYEGTEGYPSKVLQLNGIAHELTHYHFNGFTEKEGDKFAKIPLWFREGISEYGAYKYYKNYLSETGKPQKPLSEWREDRFLGYLQDNETNYKETVEKNAIDKISWKKYSQMDENLKDYSHIYYGAVFSFINYFLNKETNTDDTMMDIVKYMFIQGSKGNFKFYGEIGQLSAYNENDIKKDWFDQIESEYNIKNALDNKPPGLIQRTVSGIKSVIGGIFSIFRR